MTKRVLVLGVSGMLGHETFRVLSAQGDLEVYGAARSAQVLRFFSSEASERIVIGTDVLDMDGLTRLLSSIRPDVVINCVGLVKQLDSASDPLAALPLNALFPHRLARLAKLMQARVVHISTDCVFRGDRGNYKEDDPPDAVDLYGRSKLLGELVEGDDVITLRTSIIGRELQGRHSLVDWFLHASGSVKGFSQAIFSGLTTHELAKVIAKVVLPRPEINGLWHVSSAPIDKLSLLQLLNEIYRKGLTINPDATFKMDRSLDSTRFTEATGYLAPSWRDMITTMHATDSKEQHD
ncbi:dTDP-4-dehydrorhamnose reductase [Xylophilus ampelinus]|uniref:dTDP-4-dehydrorhamnose reductase n=1 Tax=Variovorax paradoxus TaxID=34073 RepID=A0A2W5QBD0_VARPD|nr:MAG: SDR family NAD(P)-dependent oxidoreductase [Variovorax paradoxus]VTY38946.1 dTDP-4-dehydrorhamnose reductase [Xylophilus ampelinus]